MAVHEVDLHIEQIIAAGTFGTVCVISDRASGTTRAVKVLKAEHLENPRVVARLRDEAKLLSRLKHPNIVEVRDLVELGGRPLVVMEWIRGCNLEEILAHQPSGLPTPASLPRSATSSSLCMSRSSRCVTVAWSGLSSGA